MWKAFQNGFIYSLAISLPFTFYKLAGWLHGYFYHHHHLPPFSVFNRCSNIKAWWSLIISCEKETAFLPRKRKIFDLILDMKKGQPESGGVLYILVLCLLLSLPQGNCSRQDLLSSYFSFYFFFPLFFCQVWPRRQWGRSSHSSVPEIAPPSHDSNVLPTLESNHRDQSRRDDALRSREQIVFKRFLIFKGFFLVGLRYVLEWGRRFFFQGGWTFPVSPNGFIEFWFLARKKEGEEICIKRKDFSRKWIDVDSRCLTYCSRLFVFVFDFISSSNLIENQSNLKYSLKIPFLCMENIQPV